MSSYNNSHTSVHFSYSGYSVVEAPVVVVSGEGSGEVGTSYTLTCRVTLPLGVAGVSPNIQWKRPNVPYTPASTPDSTSSRQFHTTLELNPLQSTDAGEYICQASYSLGGYASPLVRDSLTLEVISKSNSMLYIGYIVDHSHRYTNNWTTSVRGNNVSKE